MTEIQSILKACTDAEAKSPPLALATVVYVEGSVYRRPGARMLVLADGHHIGGISGGCLEADVVHRALGVMVSGEPEYVLYDAHTSNGDIIVELGCKGAVGILIEPACASPARDCLNFVASFKANRGVGAMATVYQAEGIGQAKQGDRLFYRQCGQTAGNSPALPGDSGWDTNLTECIRADMEQCLDTGRAISQCYGFEGGIAEVLIEPVHSPISLIICGAGQDAPPIAHIAQLMGWDVTVTDNRSSMLEPTRFPEAALCAHPQANPMVGLDMLDARTAVVIMTHNYAQDLAWLEHVLPSTAGYVGLLGPRRRSEELLLELKLPDLTVEERARAQARLHSPIGLDIGSETPEEIALAIISEILAVMNRASGGSLRNRSGAIHGGVYEFVPQHRQIKQVSKCPALV